MCNCNCTEEIQELKNLLKSYDAGGQYVGGLPERFYPYLSTINVFEVTDVGVEIPRTPTRRRMRLKNQGTEPVYVIMGQGYPVETGYRLDPGEKLDWFNSTELTLMVSAGKMAFVAIIEEAG